MKTIELSRGRVAIVDDEDFDRLKEYQWNARPGGRTFYAVRRAYSRETGKTATIAMHRVIIGTPHGMSTDHINGDGLDNRKENLRICTHWQNMQNQRKRINNTSGYKGVSWDKWHKGWRASLGFEGKDFCLGFYDTPIEAHEVYLQYQEQLCPFLTNPER